MLLTTAGGRHVFLYVRRGLLLAPQLIFLCVSEFSCIMCCCVSAVPSAYMLISMCYSAVVYSRQLPVLQIVIASGGAHLLACVLALHMYCSMYYMQSRYSAACDALLLTPLKAGDLHPVMHFSREQLSTGNVVRCFSGLCCDMHSWSSTHCWLVTAVSCCRMHSLAFLVTLAVL